MLVDCEVRGIYVVGAGGPGTMYCRYSLCVVLSWLEKVGIFLGVYRIGEARQVMNLTSLKLLQFAFLQNSRNSDRRANFYETNFAF